MEISVKTVEAHQANAMRKLDMRSRSDIVRYAILQGWLRNTRTPAPADSPTATEPRPGRRQILTG